MPQPTGRDLHIDTLLSELSIAYMNEPSSYIADLVFPAVPVDKQSDKYAIYEKDFWFRDEAEIRAPLTQSAGGGYNLATPGTFFCDEWSWHTDIAEEDVINADDVFDLEDDATAFVTEKLRIRRERLFAEAFFKPGIWSSDLQGVTGTSGTNEFKCWDVSGSTPISDIADAKTLVRKATGLKPNTLVVSERVHQALTNHSDVLDRYKYTQTGIITAQLLAKVFEIDNYFIAAAVYATNAEGGTESMSYILNEYDALLVYSAPRPSKRRPSGGYTFRWNRPMRGGKEGQRLASTIRRYDLEKEGGTRIEGSFYEDMKLVAVDCGVYFDDAIAAGRSTVS
jgi:hypothetical protein